MKALAACTLLRNFGEGDPHVHMRVDAAAGKGIIECKGLIKARHIDTDVLWLREQQARQVLPLLKVLRTVNVADLMTKNVTANVINGCPRSMHLEFAVGRSKLA